MSPTSNRLARFSGLALTGAGLAHFTSPQLFEPLVTLAFPHDTLRHTYTNGVIETTLGLGVSSRRTRRVAIVGLIGYAAYFGANVVRSTQSPREPAKHSHSR